MSIQGNISQLKKEGCFDITLNEAGRRYVQGKRQTPYEHFHEVPRMGTFRDQKRVVVAGAGAPGRENGELVPHGSQVLVRDDGKVWGWMVGRVHDIVNVLDGTECVHLKMANFML